MRQRKTKPQNPSPLKEALLRARALEQEVALVVRQMQGKVAQLELLTEFSGLLNSSLDPAKVREKALEATCKLLVCETASLLLVDHGTQELYWETALGEVGQELKRGLRLPINDRSIAGYVAGHAESVLINDVLADPRHNKQATRGSSFRARNMICVPLRSRGKVLGVLQAINKLAEIPERPTSYGWPEFQTEDLRLLETLGHQVAIAVENSSLYQSLKKGFYETVEALAESIEKKDRYTGGHTKRVVHFSMCIAKYLDLTPEELENVRMGALLHDIGKIGVDDAVLKKQAPLDQSEWEIMQKHPELGFDILSRVESLKEAMAGMKFHHERWDGKGYPQGLKGEEIPLIARIISVADTYDAMVSTRPYRKGLPPETAYHEIVRYSGEQFDPHVVEAFKKAFQNEKMGRGSGQGTLPPKLSNCD